MGVVVRPFLMFQGDAEAAMTFYVSVFPDAEIVQIDRYGPAEAGAEGSVLKATLRIGDQTLACVDSPVKHSFGFTPAISLFVDCQSEDDVNRLAEALAEGGEVLMELADYGFSTRFAWVNDRFGVSWQLNLG